MKSPLHYSRYAGFGQIIFVFCWWGSFPTSSRIMAFGAKKTSVLFNLQHCFSRMNVKQVNLYYDLDKLARDLTNRPISPQKVANWKGLRRYSCGNNYIQRISFHRALESIGSPFVDLTFHPKKIGRRRPSFFFPFATMHLFAILRSFGLIMLIYLQTNGGSLVIFLLILLATIV